MSSGEGERPSVFNVPNQLTAVRLALAAVLFVLISVAQGMPSEQYLRGQFFFAGMVVFLIAVGTDWLDGYWARKYGQVTQVGRIFDPFADKVIICGTFILLVASYKDGSQVAGWMAVVIVARELLVTALRSFVEEKGGDFSAQLAGKLKMVLQSASAAVSLYRLSWSPSSTPPAWLDWTLLALVWAAILVTIYSGVGYVIAASKAFRE